MKIGVYVGSFNPVHIGHIKIVKHLIKNNYLDKVIIIPTESYWDKTNLVDIKHRINMLKFYENKYIHIDNKLNNYKYTYQILDELKKEYKKDNIYLIMGADNIISFDKWKKYKYLLKYNLIVIHRNNIDIKYYLNKLEKFDNYQIVKLPNINISSTMIRKLIEENKTKILKKYLDSKVIDYIIHNSLY